MTVLGRDTFVRANQSGWGTASDGQTWSQVRSAAPWAITSNEGTVHGASALNIFRIGSLTPGDIEIIARVIPADTTSNVGIIARFQDSNNFYYGVISGGFAIIGRDAAGTFTTLKSTAFAYTAGTAYWLRFRLISNNLFLKAWQDGTAEPSTWIDTITDSTFASGGFGLCSDSSSATNTQFDSLYAVDYANCENLSVSDTFSAQSSFVPTENLSASDGLVAQAGYSTTDSLSVLDSFLSQGGATWTEINPALDVLSVGGIYLPVEMLSIADRFSGVSAAPATINVTWKTRDNTVNWFTRDGKATWTTRDGNVTWRTRG